LAGEPLVGAGGARPPGDPATAQLLDVGVDDELRVDGV
jgi:hypothetical protein